jgi:acetyltransferase-like isoleucine patch superfamily enzyme
MAIVTQLEPYKDDDGNEIIYGGPVVDVRIKFTGAHNRLVVADGARLGNLIVDFDCDNGECTIGASKGVPAFSAAIRIGQDSTVEVGTNVSATSVVAMSAVEGTTIRVGDDVMFASENQVRADDGHPIFDVVSAKRVNVSRSITIGSHVWLGRGAVVLGGSTVGDGSVLGFNALLKGRVPNNCVAVGSPAKVVRRDIVWERPHLSLTKPYYKPDASTITKSGKYWRLTEDSSRRHTGRRIVKRLRLRLAGVRRRARRLVRGG